MVSFSAEKTIGHYMKIRKDGELLEPGALVKTANGYAAHVAVDHSVLISERSQTRSSPHLIQLSTQLKHVKLI